MNFKSSPISSLCFIEVSAFKIAPFRETFLDCSLSMSYSFCFSLSNMYFESFSASYLPIRPFSAALRKRPKSKASLRISAIDRSVPSRIAFKRSRRVSDLSRPSVILSFNVESSCAAISYFCSAVSLSFVSPYRYLNWRSLAAISSSDLRSSLLLRRR